jgi:hypothetical protein
MMNSRTLDAYLNSLELTEKLAETLDGWNSSSREKLMTRIESLKKTLSTHIEESLKADPDYLINETESQRLNRVLNDRADKLNRYFNRQ